MKDEELYDLQNYLHSHSIESGISDSKGYTWLCQYLDDPNYQRAADPIKRLKEFVQSPKAYEDAVKSGLNEESFSGLVNLFLKAKKVPIGKITQANFTNESEIDFEKMKERSEILETGLNIIHGDKASVYVGDKFPKDGLLVTQVEFPEKQVEKNNLTLFACEIEGEHHLLGLSVLNPGSTGASATLMYFPQGKISEPLLLQRICYHGENSAEHPNNKLNANGEFIIDESSILENTTPHIHTLTMDGINKIVEGKTKDEQELKNHLNSPNAIPLDKDKLTAEDQQIIDRYLPYYDKLNQLIEKDPDWRKDIIYFASEAFNFNPYENFTNLDISENEVEYKA